MVNKKTNKNAGFNEKEKTEGNEENVFQNISEPNKIVSKLKDLLYRVHRGNTLAEHMKNKIYRREIISMP